ncbi:MAG: GNAT family N-acetyltransferase [Aminivibrio sp.]|jgi:diamine N-acetyltransferase
MESEIISRELSYSDLVTRVLLFNNKNVHGSMNFREMLDIDKTKQWYSKIEKDKTRKDFTITTTGYKIIGFGGIVNINTLDNNAELYIALDPEFQGRGLGSKALLSLCKYAFFEINLYKIFLFTFAENHQANAFYEKFGFIREGHLRQHLLRNEKYHDRFIYGLLKNEYLTIEQNYIDRMTSQ